MEQNPTPVAIAQSNKISGRTKAALWCLIGPTGLWIVVFFLYLIVNWGLASLGASTIPTDGGSLFPETPIFVTILNVILFLFSIVAFITWLPGIIVGIILLATKNATAPQA